LVAKYRNLIFSIPLRYGLSREDATEIFQEVCLTLLNELPRVREPRTLAAWLIRVTARRSLELRRRQAGFLHSSLNPDRLDVAAEPYAGAEMLERLQRQQMLREAIEGLAPRCRRLIEMLFFTTPALPYEDVAKGLGIAKGSVGFIRGRCLERLRRALEKRGFA
jgi:RNA polymerase sigma factor (sigma-70 family)